MPWLTTLEALTVLWRLHGLPQDVEKRLVGGQAQHDQVSICAIYAVTGIWIKAWLSALRSDKVEYLMLTLAWHGCITEDDGDSLPDRVCVGALEDVVFEGDGKPLHELGARGDDIGVEFELFIISLSFVEDYLVFPAVLNFTLP